MDVKKIQISDNNGNIYHPETTSDSVIFEEKKLTDEIKSIKDDVSKKADSVHTHNYAGSSSAGGSANSSLVCTGNSATATKLATARTITLSGNITGSANFDGSDNITINTSGISSIPTSTIMALF